MNGSTSVPTAFPNSEEPEECIFKGSTTPPLLDISLGQLLDQQSNRYPDSIAIASHWQDVRLSYREFRQSCRRLASSLLQHGLRPNDRIVVLAGNTVEFCRLFFAAAGIGAVFCIINPTFTADEVVSAVEFLDPKAVFIADRIGFRKNKALLTRLAESQSHQRDIVQIVTVQRVLDSIPTLLEYEQSGIDGPMLEQLSHHWPQGDANTTLCIQFTSGTTGPRKAALLTHGNLLNNALLVGHNLDLTKDDVVCSCSPLYHCYGLICGLISPFIVGGMCLLPSDVFETESTLEALSKEHCTVIHAVPTMFQALLDHPATPSYVSTLKLRTGSIAGSKLSKLQLVRLSKELRLGDLAYAYGMTELSGVVYMTVPSTMSLLDDISSVGIIMPHTYAKVVNESLTPLPTGSSGELLVSGYLAFQGYYKNPVKTSEACMTDSKGRVWVRTGDVVAVDSTGSCRIMGRVKDMIKRGGENVFPGDIEEALESHPSIEAAAVVGVSDPIWGETIAAFIKRAAGHPENVQNSELKAWLRKRIAPHKVPENLFWVGGGTGVLDTLPVNATGKVLKAELRAAAETLVHRNMEG